MNGLGAESILEKNERELRIKFAELSGSLKLWGEEVDRIIVKALSHNATFQFSNSVKILSNYRIKDEESFIKKALYRKKYEDPLTEIEDKVGTRIVVLTSDHMIQAKDILHSSTNLWNCKVGRDKAMIKESIKEFDYEAIHLIVSPLEENFQGCLADLPYLTCEIQIKTLFQHAYSEISHDMVYKGPYRHDLPILRKLARSMALLESTDENFKNMYSYINGGGGLAMNFLTELSQQFKKINPTYDGKNYDLELDSYILDELMDGDVLIHIDFDDISSFVESYKSKLIRINSKPNLLIGKHPVMILLSYLLSDCPEYLYDRDIDYNILNSLALLLGVSFEPTC